MQNYTIFSNNYAKKITVRDKNITVQVQNVIVRLRNDMYKYIFENCILCNNIYIHIFVFKF